MPVEKFILFAICLVVISAIFSYSFYRRFDRKILKFAPTVLFFLGTLYFGAGPYLFDYAQGISMGILYLFLGIFFAIGLISSIGTLVYFKIKK